MQKSEKLVTVRFPLAEEKEMYLVRFLVIHLLKLAGNNSSYWLPDELRHCYLGQCNADIQYRHSQYCHRRGRSVLNNRVEAFPKRPTSVFVQSRS